MIEDWETFAIGSLAAICGCLAYKQLYRTPCEAIISMRWWFKNGQQFLLDSREHKALTYDIASLVLFVSLGCLAGFQTTHETRFHLNQLVPLFMIFLVVKFINPLSFYDYHKTRQSLKRINEKKIKEKILGILDTCEREYFSFKFLVFIAVTMATTFTAFVMSIWTIPVVAGILLAVIFASRDSKQRNQIHLDECKKLISKASARSQEIPRVVRESPIIKN